MPEIFRRPFDEISADDVSGLIGWPEGLSVEFKRELPGRDGRPDAWMTGGDRFETYARDKLFKEIVAFANTAGGHLVLGIEESAEAPAVAREVILIPRCEELAERFDRAVQAIDPPIRLLQIRGVPLDDTGAGVVVFRVPQSPSAPHRSSDKDCYVRRGASSLPVSMREIQDLTMARITVKNFTDEQIELAEQRFTAWTEKTLPSDGLIWSCLSLIAAPRDGNLSLPRIDSIDYLPHTSRAMQLKVNGARQEGYPLHFPELSRPIIRGRRWTTYQNNPELSYLEQYQTGVVSAGFRHQHAEAIMHPSWLLGYLINVLGVVDWMREQAQAPEADYMVKVSLKSRPITDQEMRLASFDRYQGDIGLFQDKNVILPLVSYGKASERWSLINQVVQDLVDATSQNDVFLIEPMPISDGT